MASTNDSFSNPEIMKLPIRPLVVLSVAERSQGRNSLLSASMGRSSGIAQRSIVSPLSARAKPVDRSSATRIETRSK
jgi:hypothetical protein